MKIQIDKPDINTFFNHISDDFRCGYFSDDNIVNHNRMNCTVNVYL